VAEHQERYKEECQRIFDLQNRILASTDVLTTDEEDSEEDDSDFEELGKNIENMLSNKKTSSQVNAEREEAERRELREMMMEGGKKDGKKEDDEDSQPGIRRLKITRTFTNEQGQEYTRTEIVRKQQVIDAYVKIRKSRDDSFIRQFATLDEGQKEEMKKERRRLQEQLRRIKRNQERDVERDRLIAEQLRNQSSHLLSSKKKKNPNAPILKLKCGACGAIGHMRTNKECPIYQMNRAGGDKPVTQPVAMTEEQEEEIEKPSIPDNEDLIHIEGTKLKLSKQLIEHAEQIRKKSLVLKFPKNMGKDSGKKRRVGTVVHCDYLKKPTKAANRRRTDPVITLATIFEGILNEMRDLADVAPFLMPVNGKLVPDYYKIIKKPMDLQSIRDSMRARKYLSRENFLMDVNQIVKNSELYNGGKSVLTLSAQRMFDHCLRRLAEKEEKLMRLEKAINPLLDDNDLVALSYVFQNIVTERIKTTEGSRIFHDPVNKKFVKDYYTVIKEPMDCATLLKNVQSHKYHSRQSFLEDLLLIHKNSCQYNGKESPLTATAVRMHQSATDALNEQNDLVTQLEESIKNTTEAALEAAETESNMTGTSFTGQNEDLAGADLESVTSEPGRDRTITHDDGNSREMPGDSAAFYIPGGSQQVEDYVDVEGDEEAYQQQQGAGSRDDSLANDLQMSDNEGKLSSEGSDSDGQDYETEIQGSRSALQHTFQTVEVDDNAQDFQYDSRTAMPQHTGGAPSQTFDQDEASFDPTEYFSSIGKYPGAEAKSGESSRGGAENSSQQQGAGVGADLDLSESGSDSDEERGSSTQPGGQPEYNFKQFFQQS